MSSRIVSFDLDGILIKSDGLHDEAFSSALKAVGLDAAATKYAELAADGKVESLSTRQKLEKLGMASYYDQVKAAKDAAFYKLLPRIEVNPWAPHDFQRLYGLGYTLLVVTNCTASMAYELLDLTKIDRALFTLIAPGSPLAAASIRTKPAPDLYLRAQEILGATIDLALEDSDNGVEAAQAAGVRLVIKTTFEQTKERLLQCAL